MTHNPYQPPASSVADRPTGEPLRRRATRPVGVSILAMLHLVGGVGLAVVLVALVVNRQAIGEPLQMLGMPPALLIIGVLFLAVLTIASGVGMWMGTKWGWWLAAFYYLYGVVRHGSALMTVAALADRLEDGMRGPAFYLIKFGVRIIVHLLLVLYFFRGNVRAFFGLTTVGKARALGILVGICLAIMAGTSLIGLLGS